jgi:hypothetical protein
VDGAKVHSECIVDSLALCFDLCRDSNGPLLAESALTGAQGEENDGLLDKAESAQGVASSWPTF